MIAPILDRRAFAVVAMAEKLAEGQTGHIDIMLVTNNEVHRHVEGVFDVMRERNVRQKSEFQQARPALVSISPDVLAKASVASYLAFADRRIGEHGNEHRGKPHPRTELRHRVLFVAVVDIGLDRSGLLHHALTQSAHLQHVRRHDSIARLGHPLDFVQPAYRLHAQAEKNDAERIGHFQQLANMLGKFGVGAMDAFARFAAQLDLPARLQSDLRFVACQRDDIAVVLLRLPTKSVDQLAQNTIDATRAEIRNRLPRGADDTDFLVFGANAPTVGWLTRVVEIGLQLLVFLNDRHECEYSAGREDGSRPFP